MSNPINDGGSISPRLVSTESGVEAQGGLSIRDWFAGMALQGILASGEYGARRMRENFGCNAGVMAYMAADEVLSARTKGGVQ